MKNQKRPFRKVWDNIPQKKQEQIRNLGCENLDISRSSWYNKMNGTQPMSDEEYEFISSLFEEFGFSMTEQEKPDVFSRLGNILKP